jgi:tripartite-type tricarboxylate transporter receptor subunit TctC
MRIVATFLVTAAVLAGGQPSNAQTAAGTTRILVGVQAGASTDLVARLVADKLQGPLGDTVIVDNKPGASQRIAVAELKKSAPDGRTLMLAGNTVFSVLPHVYGDRLGYDPVKDFSPITRGVVFQVGFAASPATKTMPAFLTWAKTQPAGITFGSPGAGSTSHFAGLMLAKAAKLQMTHAAYRGGAPALNDLMGGHIALVTTAASDLPALAKAGKLSIIATAGPRRTPSTPDVPTLRELGFDIAFDSAFDFYAPAGVPPDVVARLNAALVKALAMPDVRTRIEEIGLQVGASTPQDLASKQAAEFAWWAEPVKESGFKGE